MKKKFGFSIYEYWSKLIKCLKIILIKNYLILIELNKYLNIEVSLHSLSKMKIGSKQYAFI